MLQITGREIFQKERADKEPSENWKRNSRRQSGRWQQTDGTEKAITANRDHGNAREARIERFAGPEQFRSDKVVVIWTPNQVFEKSERRGEIPQGRSPLRFSALFVQMIPA